MHCYYSRNCRCYLRRPLLFHCTAHIPSFPNKITIQSQADTMDNDNVNNHRIQMENVIRMKALPEASLRIQRYFIVILIILFIFASFFLFYSFNFNKDDSIGLTYVGTHFLIPWIIMIILQLCCQIFSIIAWTRNSVR